MIGAYIRALFFASRRNRFLGSVNEISANELYRMTQDPYWTTDWSGSQSVFPSWIALRRGMRFSRRHGRLRPDEQSRKAADFPALASLSKPSFACLPMST
jgi:hypothetical protein